MSAMEKPEGAGTVPAFDAGSSACGCYGFFFQAEDGIRDLTVTGVQTCALPIWIGDDAMLKVNAQEVMGTVAHDRPPDRAAVLPRGERLDWVSGHVRADKGVVGQDRKSVV